MIDPEGLGRACTYSFNSSARHQIERTIDRFIVVSQARSVVCVFARIVTEIARRVGANSQRNVRLILNMVENRSRCLGLGPFTSCILDLLTVQ
jgi:hypothetical protein